MSDYRTIDINSFRKRKNFKSRYLKMYKKRIIVENFFSWIKLLANYRYFPGFVFYKKRVLK